MNDWIRCAELLPPMGTPVLGFNTRLSWQPIFEESRCVVIARYPKVHTTDDPVDYEWLSFGPSKFTSSDITHWQPLTIPST